MLVEMYPTKKQKRSCAKITQHKFQKRRNMFYSKSLFLSSNLSKLSCVNLHCSRLKVAAAETQYSLLYIKIYVNCVLDEIPFCCTLAFLILWSENARAIKH